MAKKKANKNRSARERTRWKEEQLRKEQEKRDVELNEEMKCILGCLMGALALLAAILFLA